MPQSRPVKKSECLEIRLPYAAKGAFMDKCRQEGRSASESLRAYIEQQIAQDRPGRAAPPRRHKGWALLLAGLAAGGLAATALPTLAKPSAQASFEALDTNHDHVLSLAEFSRHR